MSLVIRLGIFTFCISMFFVSCSLQEDEIIPDSLPETESEETEEHSPLPEGTPPKVIQKKVSEPSTKNRPAPPEQYIVPRPPQDEVSETEQVPETTQVTQQPVDTPEDEVPETTASVDTSEDEVPETTTPVEETPSPEPQVVYESPQQQVVQTDSMYTSIRLNSDVEILFFEESVVGFSQTTNRYRILWLVSNERSSGFSQNVRSLVAKLSRYASAESDQYMYNLICSGRSLANRKSLFFQHGIGIGTLAAIDGSAQVYRYGTRSENRVQNKTRLRNYYVLSVTLQGRDLTSVEINSPAGSRTSKTARTLNRVNAPEGLTKEDLNVDVSQINLDDYYAGTLYSIWGANGDFSGCDGA